MDFQPDTYAMLASSYGKVSTCLTFGHRTPFLRHHQGTSTTSLLIQSLNNNPEPFFLPASVSEENTCFCHGECMWSGVMNVSACRFGSPAFLSLPHFLYADPALREAVEGMAPDPDKHSFYFAVEPVSIFQTCNT